MQGYILLIEMINIFNFYGFASWFLLTLFCDTSRCVYLGNDARKSAGNVLDREQWRNVNLGAFNEVRTIFQYFGPALVCVQYYINEVQLSLFQTGEVKMYGRAPRVTFMTTKGTSSTVGPGSYDVTLRKSKVSGKLGVNVVNSQLTLTLVSNNKVLSKRLQACPVLF